MKRTKKRNNFTLSPEAQKIVDALPRYKKSGFVSEAIVDKADILNDYKDIVKTYGIENKQIAGGVTFEHDNEATNKILSKLPVANYIKGGIGTLKGMAIVGEQGAELVKTESGYTFNLPKPKLFDVKITLATPEELDKIKSYTTNEEIELAANIEKWRVV